MDKRMIDEAKDILFGCQLLSGALSAYCYELHDSLQSLDDCDVLSEDLICQARSMQKSAMRIKHKLAEVVQLLEKA